MASYEPIIGLEIHAELKTKTKMFCYSLNDPDEKHPNINICPICMGHPGTLPVINREAVKKVIAVGLALKGKIAEFSQFDRKNYFYPDLPKGYQISQYQHPLVSGGYLEVFGKKVRITRVHLEEDTGRLIHDKTSGETLVDFNRAGVPLMELVTEPDLRTGEEVRKFGEELQKIFRYLNASDADMEKGQMRVEVNISLRPQGSREFGTKVEIKNINSFKFAEAAVNYEIKRQTDLLEKGEKIVQETRGWNENQGITFSQRSKEEAHDYRYFPEPDLPPLRITEELRREIEMTIPELPEAKRRRLEKEYSLASETAEIISREKALAEFFEAAASEAKQHGKETKEKPPQSLVKVVATLFVGELFRLIKEKQALVTDIRITPENFAELALYLAEGKISNLAAKAVLAEMFASGDDPSDIINQKELWQISETKDLEDMARHILAENPEVVEEYKKGKTQVLQFLLGQVMKESRGKANPKIIQDILKKIL